MREKLTWLRHAIPDLAIRTTCLVGFPGETDEDFRALLAFLEEAQFDRMGAFAYSPQEGTRAMQYEDDVEEIVKQDRLAEVVEVQRAISGERLSRFVGREVDVLVDRLEDEEGIKVGRVQWQADDVDGVTYLERGGWAQPGGFVRARNWVATAVTGLLAGIAFKLLMKAVVMPLLGAPPVNARYGYLAGNTAALPGMLAAVILGAGFGEELVFRSYLFERLGRLLGTHARAKAVIVLLTAGLFGLAH